MKITLAVPTNRGINPKTMQSLMYLVARGGYDFHIIIPEEGYTIAENRNYSVVQALNNNSEYLLFIDDDMTFEPTLLDELMANKKDICGVAYHPRSETMGQIVKFLDETHAIRLEDPEIKKNPKYQKTFECHATGTGIILIKCEVFKTFRPWFVFEYFDTGQVKLGEDWYFCKLAKQRGFKIFADPRIVCGHIGEKIF